MCIHEFYLKVLNLLQKYYSVPIHLNSMLLLRSYTKNSIIFLLQPPYAMYWNYSSIDPFSFKVFYILRPISKNIRLHAFIFLFFVDSFFQNYFFLFINPDGCFLNIKIPHVLRKMYAGKYYKYICTDSKF